MKRLILCLAAVLLVGLTPTQFAHASVTITVRGGWVSDAANAYCDPTTVKVGPGTPPSYVVTQCIGGQAVDGSFMGHSIVNTTETLYTNGAISGSFDEWIYGVYWGDLSQGGLHVRGTFNVSATDGGFVATGTIVGGTCDFAGSSGTLNSTGYVANGGYSGSWTLPAPLHGLTVPSGVCVKTPAP